jgi:hypothetical protein
MVWDCDLFFGGIARGQKEGEAYWRKHVEGWYRSGLKQREYCAREGLHERAFYRWRRREKVSAGDREGKVTLVPVSVQGQARDVGVRLESPGGCKIELADASVG